MGGGGQEGPIIGLSQPQELFRSEVSLPDLSLLPFSLQESSLQDFSLLQVLLQELLPRLLSRQLSCSQHPHPKKLLLQQLKRIMSKNKAFIPVSPFSLLQYILLQSSMCLSQRL